MIFPTGRQVTGDHRKPLLPFFGELLFVLLHQSSPVSFQLRPTVDRFSKLGQRLVRNEELFVFGPAKLSLGFFNRVFTRWIAVSFTRSLRWHSETDDGFH